MSRRPIGAWSTTARRAGDCLACADFRASSQAHAGLFDDEEARRQIKDLSIKTNERLDTVAKGQIELANQIQALREENSRLRGEVEKLGYELDAAKQATTGFLRRSRRSPAQARTAGRGERSGEAGRTRANAAAETPKKAASDPAAETREYEAALNLFRANKLKEAAAAFETFAQGASGKQRWRPAPTTGWATPTTRCATARRRSMRSAVASKWPSNSKAPDALLNIATCQQELGGWQGRKSDSRSAGRQISGQRSRHDCQAASEKVGG
jgi:TolA-binding protein